MAGNGRKAAKPRVGGDYANATPLGNVPEDWTFEELEPIGPDLPDATELNLIDGTWSKFVRKYYEAFRKTPQARQLRTEWEWWNFFYKLAVMDKSIKKRSYDGLAPEMRQSMNQYGDTPDAKRKLKMEEPKANDMAAGIVGFQIPDDPNDDFEARAQAVM
ncbi:hypothetical protein [Bifidobacterium olomucense]|uniref:Uncharacterized protein n=1 Tax=Bifidobacterium olomucense TaxID=2675324 RepID=A0A7Y0HVD0_9BIFI|nr:hypothetical protein [Bifidobacterium sp. DSM 109959]NMM98145.1 hypothetical protein [Bifidobacterium sp. DSM 109959]